MRISVIIIALIIVASGCNENIITSIDLSGEWKFQIDSLDQGIEGKWYEKSLNNVLRLPGSMTTNGKGNDVSISTKWTGGIVDSSWYYDDKYAKYREPGNVKIPFWLQPEKYYVGAAWYQKMVAIPESWRDEFVELYLERCHWETQVWVDDQKVGMQNSLATAHIFDLTKYLTPGKHQISILVDNRIKDVDPGENSHSIADHTQSNWNGIVGKIELRAKSKIHLDDVQVFPDVASGKVNVKGKILNSVQKESDGKIVISMELNRAGADPQKTHIDEKIEVLSGGNGFEYVFSRQLEGLGRKGDVLIGISTSGNSQNVVNAVSTAKEKGLKTVALLGKDGGKLKELVDLAIIIPGQTADRIQEMHIKLLHTVIETVERELFPENY